MAEWRNVDSLDSESNVERRAGASPVLATKICRVCNGSGIDPKSHMRYTSGGHDDRSCWRCNGSGIIDLAGLV